MKKEKIPEILLLSLCMLCFTACSDNDPIPITFYSDYYEVALHGTRHVSLKTGHPNYSFQTDDPRFANATFEGGSSDPNGVIVLHGRLIGETTLTITDNERNESHVLKVRVIPNYESIQPHFNKDNLPALTDVYGIYLMNNPERDLLFVSKEAISITDNKLVLTARGKYNFTQEGDKIYLTLIYTSDDNGKLTDIAVAPTAHKFLITECSDFQLHKFNQNLNLGWNTDPGTSTPGYDWSELVEMEEVGTKYKIIGKVPTDAWMPEGIWNN